MVNVVTTIAGVNSTAEKMYKLLKSLLNQEILEKNQRIDDSLYGQF